ncbi:stimulated by retinoic acid gene 6 protein-like [Oncorhynchus clarkii lewisi]|uniref:stimulated by retinoic acid gene 6 protein-like n=1 Tax=Oncorhynchus clarkii lewisi TaxID=490388 RepID=UPI0039B860F5
MIFTDHYYHNNPVMVCFCHLLLERQQRTTEAESYSTFNNTPLPDSACGSRARRRWMLLYTLMKNPRLILLRKNRTSSSPTDHQDTVVQAWLLASQTEQMGQAPETTATAVTSDQMTANGQALTD